MKVQVTLRDKYQKATFRQFQVNEPKTKFNVYELVEKNIVIPKNLILCHVRLSTDLWVAHFVGKELLGYVDPTNISWEDEWCNVDVICSERESIYVDEMVKLVRYNPGRLKLYHIVCEAYHLAFGIDAFSPIFDRIIFENGILINISLPEDKDLCVDGNFQVFREDWVYEGPNALYVDVIDHTREKKPTPSNNKLPTLDAVEENSNDNSHCYGSVKVGYMTTD